MAALPDEPEGAPRRAAGCQPLEIADVGVDAHHRGRMTGRGGGVDDRASAPTGAPARPPDPVPVRAASADPLHPARSTRPPPRRSRTRARRRVRTRSGRGSGGRPASRRARGPRRADSTFGRRTPTSPGRPDTASTSAACQALARPLTLTWSATPATGGQVGECRARLVLAAACDRVLEIDDDRVRAGGDRLGHRSGRSPGT